MTITVRAADLTPGMLVDLPDDLTAGTDNAHADEYAAVESVGGGWADAMAPEGYVVIYAPNMAAPVLAPADRLLTVVGTEPDLDHAEGEVCACSHSAHDDLAGCGKCDCGVYDPASAVVGPVGPV